MKSLFTIALLASTLVTGVAFSQGHDGHEHGGKGLNLAKCFQKLDLSDQQKKQIKVIYKDLNNGNSEVIVAEHIAVMKAHRTLIQANTFDLEAANKIVEKKTEKMAARFVQAAQAEHKAWQVLTPAQQKKATTIMKKHAQR